MMPEITVVVPYFNERETVLFTLQRIMEQTMPPKMVIFVNSSSTDDTSVIIDSWIADKQQLSRISFLNVFENTTTPASSKNVGVRIAQSEWIAFMDCGLRFGQDWLGAQYQFSCEKALDVVSGVVYATGTNWIDRCAIAQTYGYRHKRPCLPSSLIRKTIFDRTGLFAEDRRAGYDAAWLLHLKYLGITRGVNQHAVVEYIGVNFASSLSHLFLKSMRYAKPSVGLPGYYIPYVYAVFSLIFAATILAAPVWALLYFLVYFGVRTFAIPLLKSRSTVFFSENPIAAVLGSGLVGSIMDCGRVLGTWQGIHFRFLALAREGRR